MSSPAAWSYFDDPISQAIRLNRLSGGAGVSTNSIYRGPFLFQHYQIVSVPAVHSSSYQPIGVDDISDLNILPSKA